MEKYKIELKWAVIFTVMSLIWMLLEKISGLHSTYIDYHQYMTNLFAIPAILVMVYALNDKKKTFYDGEMTYMKGLISGIILSIAIAILSPLKQWIITYAISPEYFPNVIKRSVELDYYKTTEEAQAFFNFGNYVMMGAMGSILMGIVTTAIAMIFIKTKNK